MSKLKFLDSFTLDEIENLGLKCGLEIHQQLNVGKLFSRRPCKIVPNDTLNKEIIRNLRFSSSDSGEVDMAAKLESMKARDFIYRYNDEIASLVDLDEEPPNDLNQDALKVAFQIGCMLDLSFFDKIEFMRKLIVDGSIVSGFQRTAMLGINGELKTSFGNVGINGLNLEEDSCRIISREDNVSIFSLDRQGIPLIEITTSPDIRKPEQALEVASALGDLLRSFKQVKRGIGTIRQDLNVSISNGSRVEIKGAQNLRLIPEIILAEMKRQKIHLSIIEELSERGINRENFSNKEIFDLSDIFENTSSEIILKNLSSEGSGVFGISLKKFKGILGHELQENFRFATEISERNKNSFPLIRGLFHSDELPKYGITIEEVDLVRERLNLDEEDSFILIAFKKNYAIKSLRNVLSIIEELIDGVPEEVRQVDPKGTRTNFLRPMPGSARMYPETDLELIDISSLEEFKESIPELFSKRLERLSNKFSLEENLLNDFLQVYDESDLERIFSSTSRSAKAIYSIVFDLPKDIKKREGIEVFNFSSTLLSDLLRISEKDNFSKNVIRDIFISLYRDGLSDCKNLEKYVKSKNLVVGDISEEDIEKKIRDIVKNNPGAPMGALMGIVMSSIKGVDGRLASSILKKILG